MLYRRYTISTNYCEYMIRSYEAYDNGYNSAFRTYYTLVNPKGTKLKTEYSSIAEAKKHIRKKHKKKT